MVGSRVELQWLEEELEELSVGGGMGRSTVGVGVAGEGDSSFEWPGRKDGDGFLVPECWTDA